MAPSGPKATFNCAACERGAVVELLQSNRLRIEGGPVSMEIFPISTLSGRIESVLAAADAAALFAIDFEFAPFWCPECAACYCAQHYRRSDVYDGIFFDCARGICPNGHERMLID